MGNAVASDGSMAIQCQNCHGRMSAVGAPTRTGWFDEPTCQQCHTGTGRPQQRGDPLRLRLRRQRPAPRCGGPHVRDIGQRAGARPVALPFLRRARRPAVFRLPRLDARRVPLVPRERQCAERRAARPCRDHRRVRHVPHRGALHHVWRSARHASGRRALGVRITAAWPRTTPRSARLATASTTAARCCLDRSAPARCPPSSARRRFSEARRSVATCATTDRRRDSASTNRAPVAANLSASTTAGATAAVTLAATDADSNPLTFRIVSQPANGTVSLSGRTATYFPFAGFAGTDTFTYAAWDGSIDSNLATVTVAVTGAPCTVAATASAPSVATVGTAVAFTATATATNCSGAIAYDWNFGDGSRACVGAERLAHLHVGGHVRLDDDRVGRRRHERPDGLHRRYGVRDLRADDHASASVEQSLHHRDHGHWLPDGRQGLSSAAILWPGRPCSDQQYAAGAVRQRAVEPVPAGNRRGNPGRESGREVRLDDLHTAALAHAGTGRKPRGRRHSLGGGPFAPRPAAVTLPETHLPCNCYMTNSPRVKFSSR